MQNPPCFSSSIPNKRNQQKTFKKSNSTFSYKLTPEQMYIISTGENNVGIKGYKCPKKYFDYKEQVWKRKIGEILNMRKAPWPPESWPLEKDSNNRRPPKKSNFIDEQVAWAKSFCDDKKYEKYKEEFESKGRPIEEMKYKSDFDKKKNVLNLRQAFLKRAKEREEILAKINKLPEWKENAKNQAAEKMKQSPNYKKNKTGNKT